jgi:hypothetical protein
LNFAARAPWPLGRLEQIHAFVCIDEALVRGGASCDKRRSTAGARNSPLLN